MVAELWLAGAAQLLFAMVSVEELVCRQLPGCSAGSSLGVPDAGRRKSVVSVWPLLHSKALLPKEGGGLSESHPATSKCSFLQDPKEPFPSFLVWTAGSSQPGWSSAISVLQMSCTMLLGSEGFPWET